MSKLVRIAMFLLMLVAVAGLSGCPLLFPGQHDTEGEGESVGGDEGENHQGSEGEGEDNPASEGEGESSNNMYKFTSAPQSNQNTRDENMGAPGADPTAEDGSGMEGGDTSRDVVEPDVVRRDGQLLYILNQNRGLLIVDLNAAAILAQVPVYGYPRDLYLANGRAYVLVGYAQNYRTEGNFIHIDVGSKLYVVDVSDPGSAHVLGAPFPMEGDFVDSRLVGDVLYAVNSRSEWQYLPPSTEGEPIPGGTEGEPSSGDGSTGGSDGGMIDPSKPTGVDASGETTTPDNTGWTWLQTSSSWVTSVDVSDPNNVHVADTLEFEGYGNLIQVTPSQSPHPALFVASTDWLWYENDVRTTITYVDISDPAGDIVAGDSIDVPGYLADRFKMDAAGGVLRVVTSSGWGNGEVYLTTIDITDPGLLWILGGTTLEGASGEALFATRFDGPRAYIVTYQFTDPLWIVDFSNPGLPAVVGHLVVPGWSTHIEPRGNSLIALGVDDTDGQRRVKVSLFDVADPAAPTEKGTLSFGDNWAWSSAYADVKSFTVLDDTIIVPVSGYDPVTYASKDTLQFIGYTSEALTLGGAVQLDGAAMRSNEYATDRYYAVTSQELALLEVTNLVPEVLHRVPLMENVFDAQILGPDLVAEILANDAAGAATVRTETADGALLGETKVDVTNLQATHVYGQTVVLVSAIWNWVWDEATQQYLDESGYDVALVDCSDPSQPQTSAILHLDFTPIWGGYYWWGYPVMDMAMGAAADMAIAPGYDRMYYPWWNSSSDTTMVAGHWLILRGSAPDGKYDVTLGTQPATEGLAKIDLDDPASITTLGLGVGAITGLDTAGGRLYVGVQDIAGYDEYYRPLCANLIGELDPDTDAMGPLANVPGQFLAYDAETNVLVLEDYQYTPEGAFGRLLNSVSWDGGAEASLIDQLLLPADAYSMLPADGDVFFTHYQPEGSMLGLARVAADGHFSLDPSVAITDAWVQLLGAQDGLVFTAVGGGAIAQYDCVAAAALRSVTPVMGTPSRIRFGETIAYAPLGYAGLARIPLALPVN